MLMTATSFLAGTAVGLYQRWERDATGASDSMQNIKQSTIRNLLMALPPLHEHRSIVVAVTEEAAKIGALMAKIREHVEKLRELRAALISAAVTGKIDARGETEGVSDTQILAATAIHPSMGGGRSLCTFATNGTSVYGGKIA
jgi:hypothetical protein